MLDDWEKIPYMPKMDVWANKNTTLNKNTKWGQKLVVEGVGKFLVKWHLNVDMKMIKCMYSTSYCMGQMSNTVVFIAPIIDLRVQY